MQGVNWWPDPQSIPETPGVYEFYQGEELLYVGKAGNLKARLMNYFTPSGTFHGRTRQMINRADQVKWTVTTTENDAILLESMWIHERKPAYNLRLRDWEKMSGIWFTGMPLGVRAWRGKPPEGKQVWGPWPGVSMRELTDMLGREFGIRTCKEPTFRKAQKQQQACILKATGMCLGPCLKTTDMEEYTKRVKQAERFLNGQDTQLEQKLEAAMARNAELERFEAAAGDRDRLQAVRRMRERQNVTGMKKDIDAWSLDSDNLQAAVLIIRKGSIKRILTWTLERIDGEEDILRHLLREAYKEGPLDTAWPRTIILEGGGKEMRDLTGIPDSVTLRSPWKSEQGIVALARKNVNETSREYQDETKALQELKEALEVESVERIECVDISHLQGHQGVGGLIVHEHGTRKRSEWRRMNLDDTVSGDDLASIRALVLHRYTGSMMGLTSLPDLLIVDGGPLQRQAAMEALTETGHQIPVIGLAKRLEEIWTGEEDPLILKRDSGALRILQRARDDAHDWVIQNHRKLRGKAQTRVILDEVEGVGPKVKKAVLEHFGGLSSVSRASSKELEQVRGVGPELAKRIASAYGNV